MDCTPAKAVAIYFCDQSKLTIIAIYGLFFQKSEKSRYFVKRCSAYALRKVRLSHTTGTKPTTTSANDGKAASPKRSSRANW